MDKGTPMKQLKRSRPYFQDYYYAEQATDERTTYKTKASANKQVVDEHHHVTSFLQVLNMATSYPKVLFASSNSI